MTVLDYFTQPARPSLDSVLMGAGAGLILVGAGMALGMWLGH